MPTHDRQTDEAKNHVENDKRATELEPISRKSNAVHDNTCKGIWWSNKTLCFAHVEAHAATEDNREKIGQGISDSSIEAKNECEAPNFEVISRGEELLEVEWLGVRIATVRVDTVDDKLSLTLPEELPRTMLPIRKIYQCPVSEDT